MRKDGFDAEKSAPFKVIFIYSTFKWINIHLYNSSAMMDNAYREFLGRNLASLILLNARKNNKSSGNLGTVLTSHCSNPEARRYYQRFFLTLTFTVTVNKLILVESSLQVVNFEDFSTGGVKCYDSEGR